MGLLTLLFQINICLALSALTYEILFRKLTFYSYNRYYLLVTLILSMVIPLSEVEVVRQGPPDITQRFETGTGTPAMPVAAASAEMSHEMTDVSGFTDWEFIFSISYFLVTSLFLIRLIWFVTVILRHSKGGEALDGFCVVTPTKHFNNCSFFNLLFIDKDRLSADSMSMIVAHEKEHAIRLHSADKLLVELIHSFLWVSPVIYYYRRVIAENHEFEVDQAVAAACNRADYASFLLSLTVQTSPRIANGMRSGSLSRRVNMLFSDPTHKARKGLYFVTLPLMAGLVWLFAVEVVYAALPTAGTKVTDNHARKESKENRQSGSGDGPATTKYLQTGKVIGTAAIPVRVNPKPESAKMPAEGPVTILLDPGHGGKDPGGEAFRTKEKEIVLATAIRLKALLETMGAVVYLTRESDKSVSLRDRVSMGSDRADVFISLHMQMAAKENDRGMQVFYSADQKNQQAREASSRLANALHSRLAFNPKLTVLENRSVPLLVLRTPEIPSVLLHLGFLTDKGDLSSVARPDHLQFIANAIYRSAAEVFISK